MASFETRGKSIRVVVRIPGGDKKTQSFDNTPEGTILAHAWANLVETKKALGTLVGTVPGDTVTAGEMFEAFEDVARKTDSGKWNVLRLRKWQRDPISNLRIAAIVTHDIDEWVSRALARPSERTGAAISPSTVLRELKLMSSCFTWAVKVRQWIKVNPCSGATRPIGFQKTRKPAALTSQQIAAVEVSTGFSRDPKLATKTARVGAAWLLALETGMRSGEILRLRPEHYWKDRQTLHVAAEERGGRKGARSGRASVDPSRHVPLTGRAIELLDRLLETMPGDQEPHDGMDHPPYLVGLTDAQRDALWRKARTQAGMPEFTFHDAKHEACTRLSKFLDVIALSHAIGTKDVKLLRDTYYISDASGAAKLLPARLMAA